MTRRVVGVSLFGTGLFLVVAALGLAMVISPLLLKIPYDMAPSLTGTQASDATFVQVKWAAQTPTITLEHAPIHVRTSVQPDATATAGLTGDIADRVVVWNVFQQTERADNGDVINASDSRIALDRRSGAGADWSGQCLADQPFEECTPGNVEYAGQLYQFPFDAKKETHEFFDLNLGRAVPIEYRGEDTIEGLRAYRFEQVIPEQPLQVGPESLGVLMGRFAPGATSAKMMYRTHRTVWVEPVSGVIVSVKDEQHHTLVPNVGEPTVIFDATLQFDPATLSSVTDDARDGRATILALRRYVPLGLGLLGLLALVAGYLLARQEPASSRPLRTNARKSHVEPAAVAGGGVRTQA